MNVCIFSRPFSPSIGGIERVADMLATDLARAGHYVEVVTDTPDTPNRSQQHAAFKVIRTTRYVDRFLAFRRADIALFMSVSLHGLLACIAARTPLVFSHHGPYCGTDLRTRILGVIKQQLTRFYPNIAVSHFVARRIPGRSYVIHNAYDSDLFVVPIRRVRSRDFIFCARLVSEKGGHICVHAFSRVLARIPDATLTMVGDGPERRKLTTLVDDLGLSRQVNFTGALRGLSLADELQRHSCMLVPSTYDEPFGIVALEGLACCDTIIVSERGGLPEAVADCGLIRKPTVDAFAEAMLAVARARRVGSLLPGQPDGDRRASHLCKYQRDVMARKYLAVLEQSVKRQP